MKRLVLKSLSVDGAEVKAGSIVDVSHWKNAAKLEAMRYIGPAPADTPKAPAKATPKANKK